MPIVTETVTVDVEISVYCGICGHGCCGETTVDRRNNVTITCPKCEDKINTLKKRVEQLESQIQG